MKKPMIFFVFILLQQCSSFGKLFDTTKSVQEIKNSINDATHSFDKTIAKAAGSINDSTDKVTDSMDNFTLSINNAIRTGKPIAWTGIGIAGTYVAYKIYDSFTYRYGNEATYKRLRYEQELALLAAKKNLLMMLKNNIRGELGTLGLPKACDQAARILVLLPGGLEELEKITIMFKKYITIK